MKNLIMDNEERQAMRDHIIFLATQLEEERKNNQAKTDLLRRFMDREDLGWAVSDEVRSLAYQLLTDEYLRAKGEMKNAD